MSCSMQKQNVTLVTLVIFFGQTASGKTFLSQAFSSAHDIPCYNTDRVRKELAGIMPTLKRADGLGQGIYRQELTSKTYTTMLQRAEAEIRRGKTCVVLDGSYGNAVHREQVQALADKYNTTAIFIYCFCSEAETQRRLQQRASDQKAVSDGRWEVYQAQQKQFAPPEQETGINLYLLDTEKELDRLLAELDLYLGRKGE